MSLTGLFKRGGIAPKPEAISEDEKFDRKKKILTGVRCRFTWQNLNPLVNSGAALELEHGGSYTIISSAGPDHFSTLTTFGDSDLTWMFKWPCWILHAATTAESLCDCVNCKKVVVEEVGVAAPADVKKAEASPADVKKAEGSGAVPKARGWFGSLFAPKAKEQKRADEPRGRPSSRKAAEDAESMENLMKFVRDDFFKPAKK